MCSGKLIRQKCKAVVFFVHNIKHKQLDVGHKGKHSCNNPSLSESKFPKLLVPKKMIDFEYMIEQCQGVVMTEETLESMSTSESESESESQYESESESESTTLNVSTNLYSASAPSKVTLDSKLKSESESKPEPESSRDRTNCHGTSVPSKDNLLPKLTSESKSSSDFNDLDFTSVSKGITYTSHSSKEATYITKSTIGQPVVSPKPSSSDVNSSANNSTNDRLLNK